MQIEEQTSDISNQQKVTEALKTNGAALEPTNVWKAIESNPAVKSSFLGMVSMERSMAQQKEKNLVIFGVKEISEPSLVREEVSNILEAIGMKQHAQHVRTTRFRANGPVTVEFQSVETKMKVLRVAKSLKDSEAYKKVFIHMDLTKAEMERNKELRKLQFERNSAFTLGSGNRKYGMYKFGKSGGGDSVLLGNQT